MEEKVSNGRFTSKKKYSNILQKQEKPAMCKRRGKKLAFFLPFSFRFFFLLM